MSVLAIVLLGVPIAIGIGTWLATHPTTRRDRADVFGLRSARQIIEQREALEAEDLEQMLEAHNRFRRRRGESERTIGEVEMLVATDAVEQRRRRDQRDGEDDRDAEDDLEQMLSAVNVRRRARGLPEHPLDQLRGELSPEP